MHPAGCTEGRKKRKQETAMTKKKVSQCLIVTTTQWMCGRALYGHECGYRVKPQWRADGCVDLCADGSCMNMKARRAIEQMIKKEKKR
jgi:hypothetical protein